MKKKLTSRKFWICIAAFLASISTSVAGIQSGNESITTIGVVCGVLSAAIYSAAEAYCDANCIETVVIEEEAEEE